MKWRQKLIVSTIEILLIIALVISVASVIINSKLVDWSVLPLFNRLPDFYTVDYIWRDFESKLIGIGSFSNLSVKGSLSYQILYIAPLVSTTLLISYQRLIYKEYKWKRLLIILLSSVIIGFLVCAWNYHILQGLVKAYDYTGAMVKF